MPLPLAFDMMNLQYEIRICHKIDNKGTMSQYYLSFSESGTVVTMHNFVRESIGISYVSIKYRCFEGR